ncbi:hypothetical protein HOLleu_36155 [Holothuria leucospilota]|uniref:Uncharacterized protein n=1 Tax=Holothuria leucospilota TaxID=206669 RepID=A0A9Q1BFI1_HOLLE|nr:hypothetical protein HOLleu_36155 [Holothuria leucospilota]
MRLVTDQFYMDDLNESLIDVKQALDLKTKLIGILKKGSFAIRKWQSNAPEVSDETEDNCGATALGTKWDLVKDTLKVKDVSHATDGVPTNVVYWHILQLTTMSSVCSQNPCMAEDYTTEAMAVES